ncbi:zinc finger and BTB domain-containing protein 7B isoform X2 [Denticeps clupeoides]|uniref:Uncharacterized protein n=1 Tax=Denticeps clupeoides TaxID=299321 RepID=A0AAY4AAW7_9TELE|nr:zinc finger and BTB domain-containing protein 7B isoform X2 [Denticeps clupeoides]XP_028835426.1 zinc finger and BTB domain-containing protein 7B isoform X2 [Denticeps clupeoides]
MAVRTPVAMSPGEDGLIGIPFPEHSSEILSRLNAQRRAGLLCDLTLTSRGARYPTHRSVMAAVSLYFRRLFGAEEGEEGGEGVSSGCSVCQLDCVAPDALDALLEFAYTATLTIRSSGMREVLKGAQLLGIQCVADACRDILGESGEDVDQEGFEEAERASRRKRDRRHVNKAGSPVRPAWKSTQQESTPPSASPRPEYGLPHTPGREELPPVAGQNGETLGAHQRAMVNGGPHWTQMGALHPPSHTGDGLSEDDQKSEGATGVSTPPSTALGGPIGSGTAGPGGRKRKSQTPQQCPVCQKIIHGAGKLPRHMRTHTGEKPFQCSACGVRFTRNDKLKIHMRKHTGERPYPCPDCPARFLHSYDLKNHLSLHSGARPFECPLCHKAFAREDHLQRHRKGYSCLELRTRRPRRASGLGPGEAGGCGPSTATGTLLYHQDPDSPRLPMQGLPLLGPRLHYHHSLLWMGAEAQSTRGRGEGEGAPSPRPAQPPLGPGWDDEEEEDDEEDEEEEECLG